MATLKRWLTENRADTRRDGPPRGRRYAVPFARVWDELVSVAETRWRWRIVHRDETQGVLTVVCRTPVLGFPDDLTVWVSLDREGYTRVHARSRSRCGRGDLGVNRRRIRRLMRSLDRRLEVG